MAATTELTVKIAYKWHAALLGLELDYGDSTRLGDSSMKLLKSATRATRDRRPQLAVGATKTDGFFLCTSSTWQLQVPARLERQQNKKKELEKKPEERQIVGKNMACICA